MLAGAARRAGSLLHEVRPGALAHPRARVVEPDNVDIGVGGEQRHHINIVLRDDLVERLRINTFKLAAASLARILADDRLVEHFFDRLGSPPALKKDFFRALIGLFYVRNSEWIYLPRTKITEEMNIVALSLAIRAKQFRCRLGQRPVEAVAGA
jgi:hypothetical protein